MADAKTLQDKLTREQLNQLATDKGIEDADKFENKQVLAEKLEAEGVSDEELDKLTATEEDDKPEGDDAPENGDSGAVSDPKSVKANKEAQANNPAHNPSSADDLNTLHEPGSVRDGSIANENLEPTKEKHPDISANPGGRAKTAGHGERLDDSSRNSDTPEQVAKDGQETAERNTEEEGNLHEAALDSGTTRTNENKPTPGEVAAATAKKNIAAEKKAAQAGGTLSPYL